MSRVHTAQRTISARALLMHWARIFGSAISEFFKDEIPTVAAGVTYFTLLAFFPAVAAFASLYGMIADVHEARAHLGYLRGFLPPDALKFVGDEMIRVTTIHSSQLSFPFIVTLVVSLWSANAGASSLIAGLDVAYERKEARGLMRFYIVSIVITVAGLLACIGGVVTIVALPDLERMLGIEHVIPIQARWPLIFAVVAAALAAIYRYGPDRSKVGPRVLFPGAIFASLSWLGVSLLFSWYVGTYAHYDLTYGSFGTIAGFMIWIWFGVVIVLFGAELNAEIEQRGWLPRQS